MPFEGERSSGAVEGGQQFGGETGGRERLSLPTELGTDGGTRVVASNHTSSPIAPEPGTTQYFASATSTRWTRGRGNKPLWLRAGGAVAGVVIAPFVMVGRGIIYAFSDAARGVKGAAAWATGLVKNGNPLVTVLGVGLVVPSIVVGAAGGFVYGAFRGFFGAIPDIGRAIVSQATGGDINYFSLAYRKYRG